MGFCGVICSCIGTWEEKIAGNLQRDNVYTRLNMLPVWNGRWEKTHGNTYEAVKAYIFFSPI